MLDIYGAVKADSLIYPGKLSLGEGNGTTKRIWIVNRSKDTVTYTFGSMAARANGPGDLPRPTAGRLPQHGDVQASRR